MIKYDNVAKFLPGIILHSFKESESLPWPPTVNDLDVSSANDLLPPDLVKFPNLIIAGDADRETCPSIR